MSGQCPLSTQSGRNRPIANIRVVRHTFGMRRFILVFALTLTACESPTKHAREALREAETACGLPKDRLNYLGSSDDPMRQDARKTPPFSVITGAISVEGEKLYQCLDRFKSSRGYIIQQLRTD